MSTDTSSDRELEAFGQAVREMREQRGMTVDDLSSASRLPRERKMSSRRIGRIEALLHAYYQGAIPLDLLHQEQDRITTQTAGAETQLATAQRSATDVQTTLDKALDLLANCQHAYTRAPGHLRRQWNQALFLRLHVHDDTIQHADIAEPFTTLATPNLPNELDDHGPQAASMNTPTVASNGRGSNKNQIVGAAGFEPATPAPQMRCDTRLRHAPMHRRVYCHSARKPSIHACNRARNCESPSRTSTTPCSERHVRPDSRLLFDFRCSPIALGSNPSVPPQNRAVRSDPGRCDTGSRLQALRSTGCGSSA
jgi:hypothetical protein